MIARIAIAALVGYVGGPALVERVASYELSQQHVDVIPVLGQLAGAAGTAYAHEQYDQSARLAVGVAAFLVLGWLL